MNNFNLLKAGGCGIGISIFETGRGRVHVFLLPYGLSREAQFLRRSMKCPSIGIDLFNLPAKWARSVQLVKDNKPRSWELSEKFQGALLDALSSTPEGAPLDQKLAPFVKFAAEHVQAVADELKARRARKSSRT